MKIETISGETKTAYGKQLPQAITFGGPVSVYESSEEMRAKNDWPSDSDILEYRNGKLVAAETAKLRTAALDAAGYKKPTLEDPEEQFRQMVAILQKNGKDAVTARSIANTTLGTSY